MFPNVGIRCKSVTGRDLIRLDHRHNNRSHQPQSPHTAPPCFALERPDHPERIWRLVTLFSLYTAVYKYSLCTVRDGNLSHLLPGSRLFFSFFLPYVCYIISKCFSHLEKAVTRIESQNILSSTCHASLEEGPWRGRKKNNNNKIRKRVVVVAAGSSGYTQDGTHECILIASFEKRRVSSYSC